MIIPIECWGKAEITVESARDEDVDLIKKMLKGPERVALDLHVGEVYEVDFGGEQDIGEKGFALKPGECVRIEVDEKIKTPKNVFGQVCSKTSQAANGLLVANLKVDPNFEGQIKPTVFNAGKKAVRIERGLLLGSVWFGIVDPEPKNAPARNPLTKHRAMETTGPSVRDLLASGLQNFATSAVAVSAVLGAAHLLGLI